MKKKLSPLILTIMLIPVILLLLVVTNIPSSKKSMSAEEQIAHCEKLIEVPLPKEATVVQAKDSHGGFHGDGSYYSIIQLDKKQVETFKKKALQGKKWSPIPINPELYVFLYGFERENYKYEGHGTFIPSNIKNGIYFYRDKFAEQYPKEKDTALFRRYANNLIYSILDLDTGKLYTFEYDS